MKKKGFTLIELIGVIVILALLLLLIVPSVTNSIKKGQSTSSSSQIENMILAAKNWASDHKSSLPGKGSELSVTLKTLQNGGYIDKDIKNPETKEILNPTDSCVIISNKSEVYNYEAKLSGCDITLEQYTLTYNGNSGKVDGKTKYNVKATSSVDIKSKKATKSGYEFLGWNTNKNAEKALSSYQMPKSNSTLYAIFKKTITIKYDITTFPGIKSIKGITGNEYKCTYYNRAKLCKTTLPELNIDENYTLSGFYNGENNVGKSGDSYKTDRNVTLTIRTILKDTTPPKITFKPNGNNTYTSGGTSVEVTFTDEGEGLAENQTVNYAWSQSNTTVPTSWSSIKLESKQQEESKSVVIPSSTSSSLTGTYYLWIKNGVSDNVGNKTDTKASPAFKFDNTNPILKLSTSVTPNSITVVSNATAASGIKKYEYSIDGGSTWVTDGNSHTFKKLKQSTSYTITVRVTSNVNKTASASTKNSTSTLQKPTFTESESNSGKTIKIDYHQNCKEYTCSYQLNSGQWITTDNNTPTITVNDHGTIVANITDGTNTASNTLTFIITNYYVSNSGNDSTGVGSINNPFRTFTKAYSKAKTNTTTNIYAKDTVTVTEATTFSDSSKKINLQGYNGTQGIKRASNFDSSMINLTGGTLDISNLTIDGGGYTNAHRPLYTSNSVTLNIKSGTTIQNNTSTANGGAIYVNGGTVNMSGGTIQNNKAKYGAAVYTVSNTTFNLSGGTIQNNSTTEGSGGAFYTFGKFNMSGGTIKSNTAKTWGGGIMCKTTCNLSAGNVTGNNASGNAGGGLCTDGTTNISKGTSLNIKDNSAKDNLGVDVYIGSGSLVDNRSGWTSNKTVYKIVNNGNSKYGLNVYGGGAKDGTNVVIYHFDATNAAKWQVLARKIVNGTVYYGIASQVGNSQHLWIDGNTDTSGTNVSTWTVHGSSGGYWSLESAGSGWYYIKNIRGKCLDNAGGTLADANNVQVYDCNNSSAQKWQINSSVSDATPVATMSMSYKVYWGSFDPCNGGSGQDAEFNFYISITGGYVAGGKMCYGGNCRNYSSSGSTGFGYACFWSSTHWSFYRSTCSVWAYAHGSNGLSREATAC